MPRWTSRSITTLRRDELITAEARKRGQQIGARQAQTMRSGVLNRLDGTRLIRDGRWYLQTPAPAQVLR